MRTPRRLLAVAGTVVLGLLSAAASAHADGPGVNPGLDAAWEKYPAGTAMIPASQPLGQPYDIGSIPEESWVTDVWDGGATNTYPGGTHPDSDIDGHYDIPESPWFGPEGEIYADWYVDGACYSAIGRQWFRTELDLSSLSFIPASIRMVRKYYPVGHPEWANRLPINDDLFVWVNDQPAAAAGVSKKVGYGIDPQWDGLYVSENQAGSLETAYRGLNGGLALPGDKFRLGTNTIEVMTTDICRGGGLTHPVFQLAVDCVGLEPPLDKDISIRKNNRVLPIKMRILDGAGNELTDLEIAAPVLEIDYTPASPGDILPEGDLFVGQGDEGNQFVYSGGEWQFNLKVNKDFAPGTYIVYPKGGADGLSFGGSCQATFVIQ